MQPPVYVDLGSEDMLQYAFYMTRIKANTTPKISQCHSALPRTEDFFDGVKGPKKSRFTNSLYIHCPAGIKRLVDEYYTTAPTKSKVTTDKYLDAVCLLLGCHHEDVIVIIQHSNETPRKDPHT